MALVASVFSRKMRCSFSPQRSTSDIIRSVRKSCRGNENNAQVAMPSFCLLAWLRVFVRPGFSLQALVYYVFTAGGRHIPVNLDPNDAEDTEKTTCLMITTQRK
ncbi:hypothetical protein EYF80_068004 [Liparis tanakae]|uniref:Uncharacterized protein n=1 Tax=Liparis tanakae TaxID=230148 RepID=A0A4Z2DZC7_9TELE|nr:hypothetical protein EYF80_068004 [Liparis tanakae]